MADLALVTQLAEGDHHLAVLAVSRADGSVQASLVNAGVTTDPLDATAAIGLVAIGSSVKLPLLRRAGQATVIFKDGYQWASVSGHVRLVGPDDGRELGLDVPEVIRSVYRSAGGDHDDWAEFDRVMADERRCAVFVAAERIGSNR